MMDKKSAPMPKVSSSRSIESGVHISAPKTDEQTVAKDEEEVRVIEMS